MSKSWTSRLVWEARCWKIWLGRRWYWLWDSSSVSPNNCAFERDDLSSHRCAQLGYEFKMSDDSYRTSITITCGADRSWNRDSLPPCECKMTDNPQFANIQFGIYLTINVAKKNTCSDFSTNHLKFVTHLLNCLTHFPSFWLTCSVFWPPCIPDICQFWGTTALIRPVTGAQNSQKWPKQAKILSFWCWKGIDDSYQLCPLPQFVWPTDSVFWPTPAQWFTASLLQTHLQRAS